MKNFILLLCFFLLLASCERGFYTPPSDCYYCYQDEPDYGDLYIDITINNENDSVIVTTYLGNLEDDNVMYVDTVTEVEFEVYDVPIDQYYTVTAKYNVGNKTIIAVDGDDISTRKDYECDVDCFRVLAGYFDLKLKFDE